MNTDKDMHPRLAVHIPDDVQYTARTISYGALEMRFCKRVGEMVYSYVQVVDNWNLQRRNRLDVEVDAVFRLRLGWDRFMSEKGIR